MTQQRGRALLSLLWPMTLAGCAEPSSEVRREPLVPDVAVTENGRSGRWHSERARLVELWRAGGLNEGQELHVPASIATNHDGYTAIADFGLGEVVVVAPDGEWLGAWTRMGRGPGEVTTPIAVAWTDQRTLAVFDVMAPKVAFVRAGSAVAEDLGIDPSFTAPMVAGGEIGWAGVQPSGSVLLQPGRGARGEASTNVAPMAVLRLRAGASSVDTVVAARVPIVQDGPFAGWPLPGWPRPLVALGSRGQLAAAAPDGTYRVVIYGADGAPLRQLCRQVPPLPLTNAERGAGDVAEPMRPLAAAIAQAGPPVTPASIGRLILDPDGRLWVQRDRPSPFDPAAALHGVAGATFDVFDVDGRFLGEVGVPAGVRLQSAVGDTVWGLEFGAHDEPWLIAFRIEAVSAPPRSS
ncbi:MAG: hypothetical protein ACRELD_01345 [Longimicrobiales bacterium]